MMAVVRSVTPDGATEDWAIDVLTMTPIEREVAADKVWTIEGYQRGLKQFCGVERCQARMARAQRNHIGWALRAFLRLEMSTYIEHGVFGRGARATSALFEGWEIDVAAVFDAE